MNKDLPEHNSEEKKKPSLKSFQAALSLVLLLLALFAGFLEFLTLSEYRPREREKAAIEPGGRELVGEGDALRVLTWNCGYGALGDNANFFLYGGKSVYTADEERVGQNIAGIAEASAKLAPDVIFFQEVDRDSARSCGLSEGITLSNSLLEDYGLVYSSVYAYNLNAIFIPYPVPPIGRVHSGLLSFSGVRVSTAERIQLPCPFKWPVRLANYKRCLLVERVPLQNSEKELVLINLHLEEHDNGEGKAEQMKMLQEIMNEEAENGNYVIAGGTFNQSFSSTDLSAYPQQEGTWAPGRYDSSEFGEGWDCLMDSAVPTCRSLDQPYEGADPDTFQYYVVDGFIVSSNIEVKSVSTKDLGFVYTDHNPVLLDCVLK